MRAQGFPPLAAAALALLCGCPENRAGRFIEASGHVEATEVRISTKVPGRLAEFRLAEGDAVSSGQLVARIDPVDIRLARGTAAAEREQYRADAESAARDFTRMQGLLEAGSGTAKARDDARTRMRVTKARWEAAEARIRQLEQQLADTEIASPAAGVLTEKLAEEGELLRGGETLATVTNLRDAWLAVYVAEPDLSRIRFRQEAEVRTDDGQLRKGAVAFISSRAEFTPKNVQTRDERVKLVFKVKIALENRDGLFKPGMPASARLRPISD